MKALKVIGIIIGGLIGLIGLAAFVFWLGWLRAPAPEEICAHLQEITTKEVMEQLITEEYERLYRERGVVRAGAAYPRVAPRLLREYGHILGVSVGKGPGSR